MALWANPWKQRFNISRILNQPFLEVRTLNLSSADAPATGHALDNSRTFRVAHSTSRRPAQTKPKVSEATVCGRSMT